MRGIKERERNQSRVGGTKESWVMKKMR
jgi:hypothetical protein